MQTEILVDVFLADILLGNDAGMRENESDGSLSFPGPVSKGLYSSQPHCLGDLGRCPVDHGGSVHQGLAWKRRGAR